MKERRESDREKWNPALEFEQNSRFHPYLEEEKFSSGIRGTLQRGASALMGALFGE